MMNGLNLLKSRSLKEKLDFLAIEESYDILIPPILKVFFDSFEWDNTLVDGKEFYYYPELVGGEVAFPFVSGIEENLKSTVNSSDEEIIDRKLILIATNRYGFYVGTLDDEQDKILTKTKSTEGGFKVVADNIFEFLRGITDNLSDSADTEEEYRQFMISLGYEDDDLEDEIDDWKNYKGI
ncbi:hypothetical protein GCM10011506_15890 [Marivirga lumbricoides]|uniref:SMI1/KNR4 family protein n=1 Tax=Marivirga lumbricoides TaxID=1046115 RepID=A0ABQ1LWX1_9BACT|nr:hypothetical protein GCM10011506_15890 [Marivirga lumbricoides]